MSIRREDDDPPEEDATAPPHASPAPQPYSLPPRPGEQAVRWSTPEIGRLAFVRAQAAAVWHWLSQCYLDEIASANQFSWHVVAYAVGAALYLVLPQEPSFLALSLVLAIGCTVVAFRRQTRDHVFVLTAGLMCIAGVWTGALKAIRIDAPRIDHERTVDLTGWIVDSETGVNGASRMTIRIATMTGRKLTADVVPRLVAVTFRGNIPHLDVGEAIRLTARLRQLPGPLMPGGYDFARRAYFEGRGASGYAVGRVGKVDLGPLDWPMRISVAISQLRDTISGRIRAALPGARGAIAAAIIVGETRGIPDAENDALRMAGLPHMITIAGLHMSIVAGSVFLAVRWLLALFPAIALRFPIKAWAAAGALAATTVYVLISGGHLSAERAYLMSAIMLLAVIFGRPALTMRNLGLAALVLLAQNPAQVIEPGFLMSFLAVMALIAAYQAWAAWRSAHPATPGHGDRDWLHETVRRLLRHAVGVMASTLIATLATAAVTADQFFRVSPYSVLANVIVFPAIELVAMPAAVLACLAMPFGLEALPLTAMGLAIDFMDQVGFLVAGLPGGNGLVGRIHPWSTALQIGGLCWLCLWHRSWRLLGIAPIIVSLSIAPLAIRPDALIAQDAGTVAVRAADGQLRVLGARQNRFTVANWLTADGAPSAPADPRIPLDPHLGDGWICDPLGCVFTTAPVGGQTRRIAVVSDPRGFDEDCARADVVVSHLSAPAYCAETALVFDRDRLLTTGAVALTFRSAQDRRIITDDIAEPPQAPPSDIDVSVSLPVGIRPWMPRARPLAAKPIPAEPSNAEPDLADELPDIPQPPATDLTSPGHVPAPAVRRHATVVAPTLDPTSLPDLPDP